MCTYESMCVFKGGDIYIRVLPIPTCYMEWQDNTYKNLNTRRAFEEGGRGSLSRYQKLQLQTVKQNLKFLSYSC